MLTLVAAPRGGARIGSDVILASRELGGAFQRVSAGGENGGRSALSLEIGKVAKEGRRACEIEGHWTREIIAGS